MNSQAIQELSMLKHLIKDTAAICLQKQPTDLTISCTQKPSNTTRGRTIWLAGVFFWEHNQHQCLAQVGQEAGEEFRSRRDAYLALLEALEEEIFKRRIFD